MVIEPRISRRSTTMPPPVMRKPALCICENKGADQLCSNCTLNSYMPGVLLWDTCKQYSPRCDAAECGIPYGAIPFAQRNFIEKWNQRTNGPENAHLKPDLGVLSHHEMTLTLNTHTPLLTS